MKKISFLLLATWCLACQSEAEVKYMKYYSGGKALYEQKCANCHQADGNGLASLYPDLHHFDYQKKGKLVCMILEGSKNPIHAMPANPQFQPMDLSMLVTYIESDFANGDTLVSEKTIKMAADSCGLQVK